MTDTIPGTNEFPVIGGLPDELTDSEKLDYIYQTALKVGELVESITSEQVEQVRRVYHNPVLRKILGG